VCTLRSRRARSHDFARETRFRTQYLFHCSASPHTTILGWWALLPISTKRSGMFLVDLNLAQAQQCSRASEPYASSTLVFSPFRFNKCLFLSFTNAPPEPFAFLTRDELLMHQVQDRLPGFSKDPFRTHQYSFPCSYFLCTKHRVLPQADPGQEPSEAS
jgi:hypothetical protein